MKTCKFNRVIWNSYKEDNSLWTINESHKDLYSNLVFSISHQF